MTGMIRIPARFIDDHYDRGLPTPKDSSQSDRYALISVDDPALQELLSDAEHYAGACGPDAAPAGVVGSARATVRAIRKVIGWDGCPQSVRYLNEARPIGTPVERWNPDFLRNR